MEVASSTGKPELENILHAVNAALPMRKIGAFIDRLDTSADAKSLLMDIAKVSMKIGARVIQIGRYVLSLAVDLLRAFPNTSFGAIIGLIISGLIAMIPLVGPIFAALLTPLLLAMSVGMGALMDLVTAPVRARIREYEMQFAVLGANA